MCRLLPVIWARVAPSFSIKKTVGWTWTEPHELNTHLFTLKKVVTVELDLMNLQMQVHSAFYQSTHSVNDQCYISRRLNVTVLCTFRYTLGMRGVVSFLKPSKHRDSASERGWRNFRQVKLQFVGEEIWTTRMQWIGSYLLLTSIMKEPITSGQLQKMFSCIYFSFYILFFFLLWFSF